jgi:hypothetical protein
MAMESTLRTSTTGSTLGTRTGAPARPTPASATKPTDDTAVSSATATAAPAAPLRSNTGSTQVDGALQDQVARAQQAIDYLDRVSTQLEALKSELTAKLASARGNTTARQASRQAGSQQQQGSTQQLEAQVRQLAATLAARKKNAGGSVDSNLAYTAQPATQSFRIRGLDVASLKQNAPQSIAFSVGSVGGPQTSVSIEPDQSNEQVAAALDRALAPMGVHASLDQNGQLVFSTAEKNWSSVKDSIAISGRGRVSTEEVAPNLAPQQWNVSGEDSNTEALRQSLREVVQALERVHHSQTAATTALSSATVQVAAAETPPPDVQLAADDFASAASNTDYDSLLSLTSALVGVSRERVLALLGLD